MAERRALLIGVPQCDDAEFADIGQVVKTDVDRMRQALEQSDYSIALCGVGDASREPSGSRIRRALKQAYLEAPAGGVLLLYFSGHGVTINGRDYLVPSDAERGPDTGRLDPDALIPVIPADLAGCAARLVVFFVDACREEPVPERSAEIGGGAFPSPARGAFVLVSGCQVGQRCHYGETGSVFTQALAQVLDRRHPAQTLSEVIDEVTRDMRRKAARTDDMRQSPAARPEVMLQNAADVLVCDGDELTAAWRRAVDSTALLHCCEGGQSAVGPVVEDVRRIVDQCARRCRDAYETLEARTGISDPWFDQNYPVRVLERATQLLGQDPVLSPAEVATLVTAPFLREAVFAEGIRVAAGIAPGDFTRTYRHGPRTDLETTHEMHQQVVRRAEGLERRGRTESRDALAMWLVHQWLATRMSVWRSSGARRCYESATCLLRCSPINAGPAELPKLLENLLRAVGAESADHQLTERLNAVYVSDRWRGLAAVLWLAGILAADLRRMPPVVADHIGTHMEVPLPAVKNAADRIEWDRDDDALDLRMVCDHPALHVAFEDIVERAEQARETISGLRIDRAIAANLPRSFTAAGLRPERGPEDDPSYQTPVSRFQLSEDKVRELLMGRQLYDDPALAIRELYQNAMDACRYRRTRLEYLRRTGKRPASWDGKITFRQGVEGDRQYIECEDNGVGMDADTLKYVFANAGERFVYRKEYRAEQADWQDADPPLRLVSNSQFGIGVFSYFMLADEITVVTRSVGRNGIPAPRADVVRIASSGSLFQISHTDEGMEAGGTRVRLYLTGDDDEPVSALRTMRKLLWVAENEVEVIEGESVTGADSVTETWEPAQLRYHDESATALRYGEDLWWVSGEGGLAADGLRTNEEIFGLILNLRDTRRPQFTVDRKKIRKWDKHWVRAEIDKSLPKLMEWPGLTLSWLWQVAESAPEIAQQIFDYVIAIDRKLPAGGSWAHSTSIPVSVTGCLPNDQWLFDPIRWNYFQGRWFRAWRGGCWESLIGSRSQSRYFFLDRRHAPAATQQGLPVVDPIDADVLQRLDHLQLDEPVMIDAVLEAMAHVEQTAASRLRRLRKYAITGLELSVIRSCPSLETTCKKEDTPLFRALAAWAPPGDPPRRVPAGWLLKTSTELDQPLGEVLRRAAELMPADWVPPAVSLGALTGYTGTAGDAKLLSVNLDGRPPWVNEPIGPSHVVEASAALGHDVDGILKLCDKFSPLGLEVQSRDLYPSDLTSIEVEGLRQVVTAGQPLSMLQLVVIAGRACASVREARSGLERLERQGLLRLPRIPLNGDLVPSSGEIGVIDRHLTLYRRARRRLTPDRPCIGIAAAASGKRASPREAAHARMLIPYTAPTEPVTFPDLIDLAADLFCALADARRVLLDAFPDADAPTIPSGCEALSPYMHIRAALVGKPMDRTKPAEWSLVPTDIVRGSIAFGQSIGGFLLILLPYRELGAPVPRPMESTWEKLNEYFPEDHDEDMLITFDESGEEISVSEIDALYLVQTAGRLGWTLAEAHRRMARLVPIGLKLHYPDGACPDEIVRWQDLLMLTKHLDGFAPAVTGRVSAGHIARAAEETEETEEWIRERLRLYAPLFGFSLDLEVHEPEAYGKESADA